jgi:hypothetical protein
MAWIWQSSLRINARFDNLSTGHHSNERYLNIQLLKDQQMRGASTAWARAGLRGEIGHAISFLLFGHREVHVAQSGTDAPKKAWRTPVLRKLPIAETAAKSKGNEGQGGGKGDNVIVS